MTANALSDIYVIRPVTINDMDAIYPLCKARFEESVKKMGFEIKEPELADFIMDIAQSDLAFVAQREYEIVGVIVGQIVESPFSRDQKVFGEKLWYVLPEHRGYIGKQLYKFCYEELLRLGVSFMIMASHKLNDIGLDVFYVDQGFVPLETRWIKKIN